MPRYHLRTLLMLLAVGPPIWAAIIVVYALLLGAGAPGYIFGPPPLQHYRGGFCPGTT
jgi:hypothetical protein